MGHRHFERMYEDAVRVDCRAVVAAIRMYKCHPEEPNNVFTDVDFSQVMVVARQLLADGDNFIGNMQALFRRGIIQVKLVDQRTHEHFTAMDSDVLLDESNTVEPELLYRWMQDNTFETPMVVFEP